VQRVDVSSSNILAIGYSAAAQILEIEFHDGSIYQYDSVPQSVYQGLMDAASHGQYLSYHIKDQYPYRKIR
jgi:hypothetical protein